MGGGTRSPIKSFYWLSRGVKPLPNCACRVMDIPRLKSVGNRLLKTTTSGSGSIRAGCINKESSTDLSEAINSMYSWYGHAEVCYIYLADVEDASALECFEVEDED